MVIWRRYIVLSVHTSRHSHARALTQNQAVVTVVVCSVGVRIVHKVQLGHQDILNCHGKSLWFCVDVHAANGKEHPIQKNSGTIWLTGRISWKQGGSKRDDVVMRVGLKWDNLMQYAGIVCDLLDYSSYLRAVCILDMGELAPGAPRHSFPPHHTMGRHTTHNEVRLRELPSVLPN